MTPRRERELLLCMGVLLRAVVFVGVCLVVAAAAALLPACSVSRAAESSLCMTQVASADSASVRAVAGGCGLSVVRQSDSLSAVGVEVERVALSRDSAGRVVAMVRRRSVRGAATLSSRADRASEAAAVASVATVSGGAGVAVSERREAVSEVKAGGSPESVIGVCLMGAVVCYLLCVMLERLWSHRKR